MQFEYLKAGFEPSWDKDPYRVFVYTTLQERATQVSHANTGKLASEYEPPIGDGALERRQGRGAALRRSTARSSRKCCSAIPNRALESAALIMPSIDMPGVNMPHFREMADVIRRAGIYGPRDYLQDRRGADPLLGDRHDRRPQRDRQEGAGEDPRDPGAPRARRRHDGDAQPREDILVRGRVRQGIRYGVG